MILQTILVELKNFSQRETTSQLRIEKLSFEMIIKNIQM